MNASRWLLLGLAMLAMGCPSAPDDTGAAAACCTASEGLGCGDTSVEACVCAADSFCCDYGWDETCVAAVEDFGCATCPAGAFDAALED